ncbi:hypothetical protein ACN47E_008143 [Coniothyrium glycines]
MNTIKSVYYGWATLIVAGGGAYFFAKRSINADRAAKAEADRQKRVRQWQLENDLGSGAGPAARTATTPLNPTATTAPRGVLAGVRREREDMGDAGEASPSAQASLDPAPTRHAPEDEAQRVREKSKYEASDAYRSRKGDRFS